MTQARGNNVAFGMALMVGFAFIAPGIDVFAKLVPHDIPVAQVSGARFALQSLFLVPLALVIGVLHRPNLREIGLHFLRAALVIAATTLFFAALRHMPIADAISIFFVEPLIVTLLGFALLGEPAGLRRIIGCLVGFGGALLVIQPSFQELGAPALYPLGTAFLFGLYLILTRKMAQTMHPVALQGYTALAASALILPVLSLMNEGPVPLLDPVWPSAFGWWMLLGVGVMATLSHILLAYALANAPAAVVAPLQYLEIVAAVIFGFIIFGDLPDPLMVLGVAIIIGSGLYVFHREQVVAKEALTSGPRPV